MSNLLLSRFGITPEKGYALINRVSTILESPKKREINGNIFWSKLLAEEVGAYMIRLYKVTYNDVSFYYQVWTSSYGIARWSIYYDSNLYEYGVISKIIKNIDRYHVYYMNYRAKDIKFYQDKMIQNVNYLADLKLESLTQKLTEKVGTETYSILLHGPPGCGKSTYVDHLASLLRRNVYIVTPNPDDIQASLAEISKQRKVIVLFPELDKLLTHDGSFVKPEIEGLMLELLGGALTPRKSLMVIIANNIERIKLNPILSRPGRINLEYRFGYITENQIKEVVLKYYPNFIKFEMFKQYIGKISFAEFSLAIKNYEMFEKPLEGFDMKLGSKNKSSLLYC